ncbi:MAG TPA: GNAT family N-acetyltransferase [Flavipsychrobacter sp.]|nr:GNAT family N-acetyltransferase [Flavipsychrobacter sp.]
MMRNYSTRQFGPADWQEYKAIRLEALQTERAVYCASYEEQSTFPDELWQERLANVACAYFGLYAGNELIGMSGIMCDPHHEHEAELIASYIRKEYRGKGLSKLFYQARIEWARKAGLKKLVISHRESNASSKYANQGFGFQFTHQVPRHWHDGQWEDNVYYELAL